MDELFRVSTRSVNGVLHGETTSVVPANPFISPQMPQTTVFNRFAPPPRTPQ